MLDCLSLKFQQAFSFWSWCLCSLTEGEGAHIRYLFSASSDSVSECNSSSKSHEHSTEISRMQSSELRFLLGTQQKTANRLLMTFFWNASMVPDPGALPKHVIVVSSLELLLNLRWLIWEQWLSQAVCKAALSGQLFPEPKPSEVDIKISVLFKSWFRS